MIPDAVLRSIGAAMGGLDPGSATAVGGGSINRSYQVRGADGRPYFLKLNAAAARDMFEAERDGLLELQQAGEVRVPEPIACGESDQVAFLLLEHLDLSSRAGSAAARLGEGLAAQHRHTAAAHGWFRDNTIGSTPQLNERDHDWARFLRRRRLGFQLDLAVNSGHGARLQRDGQRLLEVLPEFFTDYEPVPSLLHGDLWGGNWGATSNGEPVIFDPAVYYGDREADIAMTMLFGGFGADFYAAYEAVWPLDPGFEVRRDLYNLYHVLNHLNLFGGGYLRQAIGLVENLLAQTG